MSRGALPCSVSVLAGLRAGGRSLSYSAFICVEPRDFWEDSWPWLGTSSPFGLWGYIRSVSSNLERTLLQGQGQDRRRERWV